MFVGDVLLRERCTRGSAASKVLSLGIHGTTLTATIVGDEADFVSTVITYSCLARRRPAQQACDFVLSWSSDRKPATTGVSLP